jgi:hypothetical protein
MLMGQSGGLSPTEPPFVFADPANAVFAKAKGHVAANV